MTKEELKPIDVSKYTVTESGNVIKDNLKQEAEEWLCNNLHSASEEDFIKAMVDIAESREKRIAELEAQIEKMKCCGNCKGVCNSDDVAYFCKSNNYKMWEIKEK